MADAKGIDHFDHDRFVIGFAAAPRNGRDYS